MSTWLETLLESTKESEAPDRYFWWAGLCAISAVLRKRVFMQRGPFYKLYPNIYVALVSARSGLRKGIPISIIKNLVTELDSVRVISGCNSIQGLINELSQQQTFKSGAVVSEAQGLMVSDEFEAFLTEDPKALTYLTALHNTHEHEDVWKKRLKNSPLETLKSPCLTLLIASNEALFESMVKQKDIEGGFIARTFIVHESKRKLMNPLLYSDEDLEALIEKDKVHHNILMNRLREISKLSGQMKFSPEAMNFYRSWYEQLFHTDMEDKTGTVDRLGDQVLKVAMLISASERDDLLITDKQLAIAIEETEHCLMGTRAIALEKTKSDINIVIEKVLKELLKSKECGPHNGPSVTRKKLMIATHIEALMLDRALDTLEQRGAIYSPRRNSKKEIFYEMTKETFDTYMKFKSAEGGKVN